MPTITDAVALGQIPSALPPNGAAGGDLAGSYPNPTLAAAGTTGTYTKVTTDSKGRVTSGTTLSATDVPTVAAGATGALSATDASVTNARTPSTHASTHGQGGADALTTIPSAVTGTTQTANDNSTKIATTAYTDTASALRLPLTGGTLTGGLTGTTGIFPTGLAAYSTTPTAGQILANSIVSATSTNLQYIAGSGYHQFYSGGPASAAIYSNYGNAAGGGTATSGYLMIYPVGNSTVGTVGNTPGVKAIDSTRTGVTTSPFNPGLGMAIRPGGLSYRVTAYNATSTTSCTYTTTYTGTTSPFTVGLLVNVAGVAAGYNTSTTIASTITATAQPGGTGNAWTFTATLGSGTYVVGSGSGQTGSATLSSTVSSVDFAPIGPSDTVPLGTSKLTSVAAGTVATDAVNFSQLPSVPTPANQGLLTATFADMATASATVTLTAGVQYFFMVNVTAPITATKFAFRVNAAASGLTHGFLGLYTQAGALISGSTTADTTTFTATTGYSISLGTPQTLAAGIYYVGIMFSGTTPPTLIGAAAGGLFLGSTVSSGTLAGGGRALTNGTGLTALLSSVSGAPALVNTLVAVGIV